MIIKGYVLPGLPHPLLCPEKNPGYQRLRNAFEKVRAEIEASEADLLCVYSTMWPSVIGHQIQANPQAKWTHVDELFHDLGSIPYDFKMDQAFAEKLCEKAKSKGLHARTVNYHGFPIDTGSVTALILVNPDNRIPAIIQSSNVYADRVETVVLGKATRECIENDNRKAIVIVVSTLSNRLHQDFIDLKDDRIHSLKDDEWNRKLLEFFAKGRLEDVSQLSRQIHKEARVKKVVSMKSFWWMSAVMGQTNKYAGEVYAYEPVYGTGSAVIGLTPTDKEAPDLEFDEDDPESFTGDRNVLSEPEEAQADGFVSPFGDSGNDWTDR